MKVLTFLVLAITSLLLLIVVGLSTYNLINKKYKYTWICVDCIPLMLIVLLFFIITLNSRYNEHIGGLKHKNIKDIYTSGAGYLIELDNGRVIEVNKVIYGEETILFENTHLIEKCILGFEIYDDTNLLVVKPDGIDFSTMAVSEKKHYLSNKYIKLK